MCIVTFVETATQEAELLDGFVDIYTAQACVSPSETVGLMARFMIKTPHQTVGWIHPLQMYILKL